MCKNLFSEIEGKGIIICDLSIEHYEKALALKVSCIAEDYNTYFIVFENVSELNLSEISYPFQVCGFQISDHSSLEHQKSKRFYANDCKNGKISFYCEDFEIFNANR